jgi:uncharacterized protein YggU (UPF0235/DUF167 family)
LKERDYHLHNGKSGAAIAVRIIPGTNHNEILQVQEDGTILVRLIPAASGENMNKTLLKYLAGILGVNIDDMEIIAGESGSHKLISILGIDKDTVQARLYKHIR